MKSQSRPKLKPWTLFFPGQLEVDYQREKIAQATQTTRRYSYALAVVVLLTAFVIPAVNFAHVLRDPGYMTSAMLILVLPLVSVALSYFPAYQKHYETIQVLGGWLTDLLIASTFLAVPQAFVAVFFPITLIKLVLYAVSINFRFPAAMLSATGSATIYFVQYYNLQALPTVYGGPWAALSLYGLGLFAVFATVRGFETVARESFWQKKLLEQEKRQTQRVLHGALPNAIAKKLTEGNSIIAEYHPEAGVIFADLVGFTAMSKDLHPKDLVATLNDIFTRIDQLALRHNVEKIKTIGDAWMGASGIHGSTRQHIESLFKFAVAINREMAKFREDTGLALQVRIGVHVGPIVAGVIGRDRYSYDIWGSTVNLASRLVSTGAPDTIQLSSTFKNLLPVQYKCLGPFTIDAKGLGIIEVWRADTTESDFNHGLLLEAN